MTLHTTATQQPKHSIPHFCGFELRSVLLVAALAVGAAGAVRAQTSPASPNSPPSKVAPAAPSTNSATTGAVPQNRATTQDVEAAFNRADTNKDGKLDRQEAEHFPAVAQRFEQIDTNRDTFISLAELAKAAAGS